ncbi:MAG: hypothetical protein JWQ39_1586 [Glaciihabitans sp.]|nr:hypothetical protein [Glaciihabitans sp.]
MTASVPLVREPRPFTPSVLLGRVTLWMRRQWLELTSFGALAVLYSAVAIQRQITFRTAGWDLGIFVQAIRNYAQLRPPIVILKGPGYNLLGDHFHPILAVLAPFYAMFPTAITLLVAQAILFALGSVPLVRWAQRAVSTRAAAAVALVYGLSFGLGAALAFDFHEIAFAVPLISFSISALGQQRSVAAVAWAMPLIFVKEDLGLTFVAVVGVILFARGNRKLGLATAIVGTMVSIIEVTVVLPFFSSDGTYAYWSRIPQQSFISALGTDTGVKLATLLLTAAIAGFACFFSPLALAAVPTLLWRFVSNDSVYWGITYHYSAVLMPIMVAALIDGVVRFRRRGTKRARIVSHGFLAIAVTTTLGMLPSTGFAPMVEPSRWAWTNRNTAITTALAIIPSDASVAASDDLIPQLTSRDTVIEFANATTTTISPKWIVVDAGSTRHFKITKQAEQRDIVLAESSGYRIRLNEYGVTLLER